MTIEEVPLDELQGSMKTAPPWFMRASEADASPYERARQERPKGPMRVVKLVLGILSIALALLVASQLFIPLMVDILPGILQVSPITVSLVLAAFLLMAGVVGIVTRDSKPGGIVTGFAYLLGALAGFLYPGALEDLFVWAIVSLALAAVFIIGSVRMDGGGEKPVYKRVWLWVVAALSVLLLAGLFLGIDILPAQTESSVDEPEETDGPKYGEAPVVSDTDDAVDEEDIVVEEPEETAPTYGDTVTFDNLEFTFGDELEWKSIENAASALHEAEVFAVPVTVKSLRNERYEMDPTYFTIFGPAGDPLDKIGGYFEEVDLVDLGDLGELEPDAEVEAYVHLLYDGDGDYKITFTIPFEESVTVSLPVQREAGEEGEEAADETPASGTTTGEVRYGEADTAPQGQAGSAESDGGMTVILPTA